MDAMPLEALLRPVALPLAAGPPAAVARPPPGPAAMPPHRPVALAGGEGIAAAAAAGEGGLRLPPGRLPSQRCVGRAVRACPRVHKCSSAHAASAPAVCCRRGLCWLLVGSPSHEVMCTRLSPKAPSTSSSVQPRHLFPRAQQGPTFRWHVGQTVLRPGFFLHTWHLGLAASGVPEWELPSS